MTDGFVDWHLDDAQLDETRVFRLATDLHRYCRRMSYVDMAPGTHRIGLSLWGRGRFLTATNYLLTVPEAGEPLGGFTLAPGDRLAPYRVFRLL